MSAISSTPLTNDGFWILLFLFAMVFTVAALRFAVFDVSSQSIFLGMQCSFLALLCTVGLILLALCSEAHRASHLRATQFQAVLSVITLAVSTWRSKRHKK